MFFIALSRQLLSIIHSFFFLNSTPFLSLSNNIISMFVIFLFHANIFPLSHSNRVTLISFTFLFLNLRSRSSLFPSSSLVFPANNPSLLCFPNPYLFFHSFPLLIPLSLLYVFPFPLLSRRDSQYD